MTQGHQLNRPWLPWVIVPLSALALVVFSLWLAGRTARDRTDDIQGIVDTYDPGAFSGLTMAPDGSAELRLEKNDIYWLIDRYGLMKDIEENYDLHLWDGTDRFGFRINGEEVNLYLIREKWGFIPVSYEIRAGCASMGSVLTLTVREVVLDRAVSLPESWWPTELQRSYTFDFAESDLTDDITRVSVTDTCLLLQTDGIADEVGGQLETEAELLDRMRYYGVVSLDPYGIYAWLMGLESSVVPMDEAMALVLGSGAAESAMRDLLSACTEASRESVFAQESLFVQNFIGVPLQGQAAERQQQLENYFSTEQSRYEKLLTSVREMYRAGRLRITETGWELAADGTELQLGELSGLSATNADARILFLEADVAYGSEISTSDMPLLKNVPRADSKVIRDMDREKVYDLGVVLSTEGGVPVLLHFGQDGGFRMTDITNDQYIALLVQRRNPVIDIGEYLGQPAP